MPVRRNIKDARRKAILRSPWWKAHEEEGALEMHSRGEMYFGKREEGKLPSIDEKIQLRNVQQGGQSLKNKGFRHRIKKKRSQNKI